MCSGWLQTCASSASKVLHELRCQSRSVAGEVHAGGWPLPYSHSSFSSFLYPVIVLAVKKLILFNQVVQNGPATFAAIVVLDRVLEKAKSDKTWLVMLDRVVTALLVAHSDSQLPLVVEAALHPEAHLLAKEVAAKSNLLSSSRAGLLCALQQHLDVLKLSRTGAGVLKALHKAL